MFLDHVTIKTKLALVLAISGAALVATTVLGASTLYQKMVSDREQQTKRVVEVGLSIVQGWYERMQSAGLSTEAAQAAAITALRSAHYGNAEYFFINRYDGVTILNTLRPELEGRYRMDATDPDGVPIVRLEIEAGERGGGLVHYRYPRAGSRDPVPKVSYIAGFDPWQWAIGSGAYTDDIEVAFHASLAHAATIALAIFGCAMLCAHLVNRNVATSLGALTQKMTRLAAGEFAVDITEAGRGDEVGNMAKAMRVFRENAQAAQLLAAEREKRRELELAMGHADRVDALGKLATGVAHDLNNALVPVLAMTKSVMSRYPKDSREYGNLDLALMGAQRARDLVQQILAFGRKQAVEFRDVAVAKVVQNSIRMLRAVLPSTIRLASRIDPVPAVHGDPGQLGQVLVNLVTNAAHAIGEDAGTITVTLGAEDAEHIRLAVADTGCGMDEKTIAHIFEPFFTTKAVGKGTGLGMSVVQGIVSSHGGSIKVDSARGDGTEIRILLPVARPETEEVALVDAAAQ